MRNVDISIVLPCYNEGFTFEKDIEKIVKELKKLKKNWEIIFVEDKSYDKTKDTVEKLVKTIKNSRAIYHNKNKGRGRSVVDGIKAARGENCGFLDVDLEVSETYIPLFIKEMEKGADLVVGKRFYEGGLKAISRVISSKVYAISVKLLFGLPVDDTEAGYKFFRRKRIIAILPLVKSGHWFWDTEICARAYSEGMKISQVPVLFKRRAGKKTTVKLIPDTIDYIRNLIRLKFEMGNIKHEV